MRKIRVLIVDDSTVIRMMLSNALSGDDSVEVAGVAANGKIALAKIPQLNPDVVTLDMEMPEMDGITTLSEIRKLYPKLPVIMFSTLTQRGAEATLEALSRGANDYVTKPANVGSVTVAMQSVRDELLPKITANCSWFTRGLFSAAGPKTTRPVPVRTPVVRTNKAAQIDIVAIGSSTGGPNALAKVLGQLPADIPVPIVVTQHMPPIFTKHLADRLNQQCGLPVREGQTGDELLPGTVTIAPGDFHMVVERKGTQMFISLNKGTPENSCRPAVDVMFRSVAQLYRQNVLAVVLTGMGQDGMRGSEVVRGLGGRVIAQDEASSVVWGMPGSVVNAGLADLISPLNGIADEIVRECAACRAPRTLQKVGT